MNSIRRLNFTQISFRTTYYFLILAFVLAFVTSIYVKKQEIKTILWIECVITGYAAYIYSLYNAAIDKHNLTHKKTIGWNHVNELRYRDWAVTTPLMLVSLTLILSGNANQKVNAAQLIGLVFLDWIMLYFGYLGEKKKIGRLTADILGFIPFAIIFWYLYNKFIHGKHNRINKLLYVTYFVVWFLYGVLYMFSEKFMNTVFNILDCIAKAFVAIGIVVHYSYREKE